MDAAQIRTLKPRLNAYLARFDDCFHRRDTREHLAVYVDGQLSESSHAPSPSTRSHASTSASYISQVIAFLASGRLNVRNAMGPSTSNSVREVDTWGLLTTRER